MSQLYEMILYLYGQTRVFQNESDDEIVYQMIRTFLTANTYDLAPAISKQLSIDYGRLPKGKTYSELLSLFGKVSPDEADYEYKMVKTILLYDPKPMMIVVKKVRSRPSIN